MVNVNLKIKIKAHQHGKHVLFLRITLSLVICEKEAMVGNQV